jgi:hypothetical protein
MPASQLGGLSSCLTGAQSFLFLLGYLKKIAVEQMLLGVSADSLRNGDKTVISKNHTYIYTCMGNQQAAS